jgi:uncharacterized membrane protein YfcA
MDAVTLDLAVFLLATFAAALVAGLAGFAFGLVAAAVWLHVLTPLQTASLIIAFGLIVQGIAVWKLRGALQWSRLWPFLLGGLLGVPIGVVVLAWANPDHLRAGVGALLILYSVYGLVRPVTTPVRAGGAPADAGVGLLNGILGGATGLAGILVTIWCGLRGWPKDVQRTVFQPVGVAIFAMSALMLGLNGVVDADTVRRFFIGLPILLAGTWLGLRLYGRIDEAGFRKIVLALLLASGVALIFSLRPSTAQAEEKFLQAVSYCADLKRVVALATTKDRFAAIAGKAREGSFLDTSLPLTGWKDCSLYGAGTYTCDSPKLESAAAAETAQADILGQVKSCLGEAWSEAVDRSSPSYVVLHHAERPVSITLSTDQTDDRKHVVHLILFVRRN